jgi:excisionase family DNA binding protein
VGGKTSRHQTERSHQGPAEVRRQNAPTQPPTTAISRRERSTVVNQDEPSRGRAAEVVGGRLALTVPEVAQLLGIGQTLAWKLVRSGEIRSRHIGRAVRVPVEAVEAFLAAG